MESVLFVDDEPRVLDGLRRMLRNMRREWDMHFEQSGVAALELLAQAPFDVVVSDMRMPGMSGVELLGRIKELYPDTLRLVLSGHAERDAIMQAFGVAQQYLVKPSDPLILQRAIESGLVVKRALHSPQVQRVLGGLTNLPALPKTYQDLVNCLRSPKASLDDVGRIVGQDIGMAADILRIVNSAYFGLPKAIATIERAVAFLGLDTIMAMTLEHGLFGSGKSLPVVDGFDASELGRRSLRAAAIARGIARSEDALKINAEDAFLVSVLHDVGKLVLANSLPEQFEEIGALARANRIPWHAAEKQVLGVTHAEVGAYLLGTWGFQNPITEAVLFHEEPSKCPAREIGLAGLTHVACALAGHPGATDPQDPALGLDPQYITDLAIAERWPAWCRIRDEVLSGDSSGE